MAKKSSPKGSKRMFATPAQAESKKGRKAVKAIFNPKPKKSK